MKALQTEYAKYKELSNEELTLKDAIIDKVMGIVNKQTEEMKTLKTVISVPVLRNQMNQFEFRGVRYQDLIQQCTQIIKYASKGQKHIEKPVMPYAAHSSKRSEGSLLR